MAAGGLMLLDTCALLWLAEGNPRLTRRTLKQITEAPELFLSAVTGFEVALKAHSGQLRLPGPPQEWMEGIVAHFGLAVLPMDLSVAIRAAGLPTIHTDPCDRFIIATALLHDLVVVTADERFPAYGIKTIL
jgi:PIN domain nuclease of toxin-antitoxin system